MVLRMRPGSLARLNAWLNDPDDPLWERPGPTKRQQHNDVLGALVAVAAGLLGILLTKSMGAVVEGEETWRAYVATAAMIAPLALRRRAPILVLTVASALFLGLSYLSPEASVQLAFQVSYFAALYTAVAWARDRRLLWIAMGLVLLTMALWVVVTFTAASGYAGLIADGEDADGPLPPVTAAVIYTAVVNLAYFGGAILIGRSSWRSALQRARLARQAQQIAEQSEELSRRAVVDERLRIARELHDVVAHHVSVIGVQAGAARKVRDRDPAAATRALRAIEDASRTAVAEMRSLLGVLRSDTLLPGAGRAPEPDLQQIDALVAEHSHLDVTVTRVEEHPGDLAQVPAPVALSLYRIVQESLANVERHSTARRVAVTLRTGTGPSGSWVEAEIVDDGVPRAGTAGSGYGLGGIRERVHLHGGEAEIGPRVTARGWRVRARLPIHRLAA
ncbi:sensor histidine kinase [Quadrisphaera sp. GCM10027208]|uniref:sensor histidine kinase n=1 Tax=Quadrisphaera sp. GCM10027208 TaxID=3273423 RepID=UPI00360DBEB7